jgi:UDP-2,3-diacylglucosamine pyrophosphatase LpxH
MSTHLFVSDIHLGTGQAWDWARPNDAAALAEWLAWVASRDDVKDLVLLGDSLDNWICPPGVAPPTAGEILNCEQNAPVIAGLAELITRGVGVYVVRGNHDCDLTQSDLARALPGAHWCSYRWHTRAGGIQAEHGHMKSLFNSPDPCGRRPPFGYWISRALTRESGKPAGDMMDVVASAADDVLEAIFTSQTIAGAIWEAVCEQAGLSPRDTLVAPWGRPVTCSAIGRRYRNLLDEWRTLLSTGELWRRLQADCGDQRQNAKRTAQSEGWRCVVNGHSHKARLAKKTRGHDYIYANCGSWSRGSSREWVEVARDGDSIQAELRHWQDGAAVTAEREQLS